MAVTTSHPAICLGRLAAASSCLLLLVGCQNFTVPSSAHVRVIDLSPDAITVDIYQAGGALAYNLDYGTVTSYVSASPGTSTLTVDLAGSRQVLSAIKGNLAPGGYYTMLVKNSLASLQQVLLTDKSSEPAVSGASVRLIHQAPRSGAVDVYLVPAGQRLGSQSAVVTNLVPGQNTGYLQVPSGVFAAVMLPAGTMPSPSARPTHTGTQRSYDAGGLHSLILIDALPTQPGSLQVIATVDADPHH